MRQFALGLAVLAAAGCASGTSAPGGAGEQAISLWQQKVKAQETSPLLSSGACRRVADGYSGAEVTHVEQQGGSCSFVLRPADARAFVSEACTAVSPLRDLPGGPNAHATLIEVRDVGGALRFVLTWIPGAGRRIGEGSAWIQPGWTSCAIVGALSQNRVTFDDSAAYTG